MPKFIVDFEFAGHVEVEAEDKEQVVEFVRNLNIDALVDNTQNFNVGKYYVEEITKN